MHGFMPESRRSFCRKKTEKKQKKRPSARSGLIFLSAAFFLLSPLKAKAAQSSLPLPPSLTALPLPPTFSAGSSLLPLPPSLIAFPRPPSLIPTFSEQNAVLPRPLVLLSAGRALVFPASPQKKNRSLSSASLSFLPVSVAKNGYPLPPVLLTGPEALALTPEATSHIFYLHQPLQRIHYPTGGNYLQCAAFAQQLTGMDIYANARKWWKRASRLYERGDIPVPGSVLAFKATQRIPLGHVAVVARVISSREVVVEQANWGGPGGDPGGVTLNYVIDVSPQNNWSAVRVSNGSSYTFGAVYPTHGFIYNIPASGSGLILASAVRPPPVLSAFSEQRTVTGNNSPVSQTVTAIPVVLPLPAAALTPASVFKNNRNLNSAVVFSPANRLQD